MTDEDAAPPRVLFWFHVAGEKYTHLDLTGNEVLGIEKRLGIEWSDLRPVAVVAHKMAMLEAFLARSDPEGAAARVGAMTMGELDDAVEFEDGRSDDLPEFVDGLPKAVGAT